MMLLNPNKLALLTPLPRTRLQWAKGTKIQRHILHILSNTVCTDPLLWAATAIMAVNSHIPVVVPAASPRFDFCSASPVTISKLILLSIHPGFCLVFFFSQQKNWMAGCLEINKPCWLFTGYLKWQFNMWEEKSEWCSPESKGQIK